MRCLASSATAILTPASAYFMVRRLNDSMRDAGSSGAACRVKTCGTVGGREVGTRQRSHCGQTQNKFDKIARLGRRPLQQQTGPPQGGRYKSDYTKSLK